MGIDESYTDFDQSSQTDRVFPNIVRQNPRLFSFTAN